MPFQIERLHSVEDCLLLREEWRALHETVEPRTPFGSFDWNTLWWKHYSRWSVLRKREFFLHIVRDSSGALRAIAPWAITSRPGVGPLRLRFLTAFGADTSLTEIRGVICRRDEEPDIVDALSAYLTGLETSFDAVEWLGIRTDGARDLLEREGPLAYARVGQGYILPLPRSWEELRTRVGSNMRKYLRRAEEKIEELGSELSLDAISDKAALAVSLENFLVLHSKRATAANMFAHPDRFQDPVNRGFLVEVFNTLAEQGSAVIFELRAGSQIVACRLAFIIGPVLYIYYSGYDPVWRDYSVGTLMMARIIQWAIKQGFKEVNLSFGRDRSKLQWKPLEFIFIDGVRFSPGLRGQAATRFYAARQTLRSRQSSTPS